MAGYRFGEKREGGQGNSGKRWVGVGVQNNPLCFAPRRFSNAEWIAFKDIGRLPPRKPRRERIVAHSKILSIRTCRAVKHNDSDNE